MTRGTGRLLRQNFHPFLTNRRAPQASRYPGRHMKLSTKIALSVVALTALVAVATMPQLLGSKVSAALAALAGADPRWLAIGAGAFGVSFLASVAAWRAALAASGGEICARQAAARIGVGCLINAVAPAKLGDAAKVALLAKVIDGRDRLWTVGGVYAGLGAAHGLVLAALVVAASATGAGPLWAALVILPAMDLAGTIPLTPGNIGVASGAAALALQSRGIGVADALGVGIAIQALQTTVSAAAGTVGALYLARPNGTARRWAARGAAVAVSVALAAAVGVFVLDLV